MGNKEERIKEEKKLEPKTKKIIGIFVVIILIALIILGLMINKNIFKKNISNVNSINDQMKTEINDLFQQDESERIIIGLGGESTANVKRGTEAFGVPFAFSPENPQAWGTQKNGCNYNIKIINSPNDCTKNGWANPLYDVYPGTTNQLFDEIYNEKGYALIKIEIPKDVEPCIQRFMINVSCRSYPNETTADYFNLNVIK